MKADTVVIGSGISGLTLAALLAKYGRRVVVCERHSRPGGSIKRFRRGGISFDTGFHYSGSLGRGELLWKLWEHIGIDRDIDIIPFPEEGHDLLVIGEEKLKVRAFFSYSRFMEELNTIFPNEKKAIESYFSMVEELCAQVPFYNPSLSHDSFHRDFFRFANVNFMEYISGLTSDPSLHAVLSAPSFLYGVLPERANLAAHSRVAHSFYTGVCGIRGGGQALVNALTAKIAGWGGEVISGFTVEKILEENGETRGVVSGDGETIEAREVVFSGNPKLLPGILPGRAFRPAFLHRMSALESTMSMFMLFGAKPERELQELRWKNIWRMPSGFSLISPDRESRESMVMISAPSVKEGDGTDKREREVIIMAPAWWKQTSGFYRGKGRRGPGYDEWKEKRMESLIYTAGQVGIKDIRVMETATPCTFVDELASPEGGAYGVQHCLGQYNPGPVTRLRGFWLTGQAIVLPGIVGASLSSLVTAERMPGMEDVWKEIAAG
jgi:all-trans-retinol 13,14-reductase